MIKQILLSILAIIAISVSFASIGVNIEAPSTVETGSDIPVTATINLNENEAGFDYSGMIPTDSQVVGWDVVGIDKSQVTFETYVHAYLGKTYNINHWKFGSLNVGEVKLTYYIKSDSSSDKEIVSLWFYPTGFNTQTNTVSLRTTSQNLNTQSPLTGRVIQPVQKDQIQNNEPKAQERIVVQTDIFSGLNQFFSQVFY